MPVRRVRRSAPRVSASARLNEPSLGRPDASVQLKLPSRKRGLRADRTLPGRRPEPFARAGRPKRLLRGQEITLSGGSLGSCVDEERS